MLAQSLNNNLRSIEQKSLRTKASKFSRLFVVQSSLPSADSVSDELYKNEKLAEFVAKDKLEEVGEVKVEESSVDAEIGEYIVENPQEIQVDFPVSSSVELTEKLPFFRSVTHKLAAIYG